MAHHTPSPVRALGTLLRALLGLTALLALVAGTPYLLLRYGHQPTDLTGGLEVLLQPDDGDLFFVTLTCIGWAAWTAFTLSAAVELVAVLRRRSAPRIKGLGGMQSLAGFLIGGIVLLIPTAASAATPAAAVAVAATHTPGAGGPSASPAAGPSAKASVPETAWPTYTVSSSTEAPWDVAVKTLGSGPRWKDIAALNPGVPGLASGDSYLPKGQTLKLPADAKTTPAGSGAASAAPASTPDHRTDASQPPSRPGPGGKAPQQASDAHVTVEEGDSLWSIADAHGNPGQWRTIFEANKGKSQPDGSRLTDPDLIIPGLNLTVPGPARTPADKAKPPAGDEQSTPPARNGQTPDTKPPVPEPSRTAPQRDSSPAPRPETSPPADQADKHAPEGSPGSAALAPAAVWAGAGILAAGLIGTVATRRILQQRRRRPGRRIPMPKGRAAATEQSLRSVQHVTGFDLLDTSLRALAHNLAADQRDLPLLEAVVLHESRVELHLAQGAPPCPPFSATKGREDLWTCPANSPDLADPDLAVAEAPYPALVTIGWDPQGHLVLIDLEHVGILNLTGDPDSARHALQAIAIELATTSLSDHVEVTAVGAATPELDIAVPERVARAEGLSDAATTLAAHTAEQRHALDALAVDTLRSARLRDEAGGAWTPHILLADDLPDTGEDEAALQQLFTTLSERPRTASAVITAAPTAATLPADAWTIACQGPDAIVALPGSGLPIRLQGLTDAHFADAVQLLSLAASDTDEPAEWAHIPEQTTDEPPAVPVREPESSSEHGSNTHAPRVPFFLQSSAEPEQECEAASTGPSLADVLALHEDANDDPAPAPKTTPATGPAAIPAPPVLTKASSTTSSPAASNDPDPGESTAPMNNSPAIPPQAAGPEIRLLGPVSLEGATGRVESSRKRKGIELAAYLILNPGADHHAIDDAMWPGQMVKKSMRNAVISRLRSWLGTAPDGTSYFPRIQEDKDHRYSLGPLVTCDWTHFQHHARTGLADTTEDGDLALRRALALVRGRPFAATDPQRYAWAEPAIQEMISAIVDVAHELSTRRREAGDIRGALWAANQGLLAAEENELLHRCLFLTHHSAGDIPALRKAAERLARINDELGGGVDMEAETAQLLRSLLPRPVHTA